MASLSIGVDLGGTKILAGLVDDEGMVLATERQPTPRGSAQDVLAAVADTVRSLASQARTSVDAVGLGVPGAVDRDRATVFFAPNLGWTSLPVRAMLQADLGIPVSVENDGNAAAWGEFAFGAASDIDDDVTAVTVGTGIGGGIIVDGRLLRGSHGAAGEIGHLNVVQGGRPCGCGRNGCWEQYASGNALVREARALAAERRPEAGILLSLGDGSPEGVQGAHVTEAAQAGDPIAMEAFRVVGTWLGRGLADLSAVLDPAAFIVGGGVSEAGDLLLASARQTLMEKIAGGQANRPSAIVRAATLGNSAGLIGVAAIAREDAQV